MLINSKCKWSLSAVSTTFTIKVIIIVLSWEYKSETGATVFDQIKPNKPNEYIFDLELELISN